MKLPVQTMITDYFNNDRKRAARACSITVAFLNNMVSQKRQVIRLDNGDWLLDSKKHKIFKTNIKH